VADVSRVPNISIPPLTATTDAAGNTTFTWNTQWWRYFSTLGTAAAASSAVYAAVYAVTPAGAAFRPDLSKSNFQQIVLAANSTLIAPANAPSGVATTWVLIVDNPTAAQLTVTPGAGYYLTFEIVVAANSRAQITWTNDQSDNNTAASSSFNGSIPPSS
jgi:hypothetical protein